MQLFKMIRLDCYLKVLQPVAFVGLRTIRRASFCVGNMDSLSITKMPQPRSPGDKVGSYPYCVTAILVVVSTLSFVDRSIFSLLVDPLKRDLALDEAQIGLLAGFAFALFYSVLGLPLGRYADVGNRRLLIIGGVVAWSLATAACGFARGFGFLFLARAFVGTGEATLGPAAFSLLAAYFPRSRLGVAMSLFAIGVTLGNGAAVAMGGLIIQWARSASAGYLFGLQDSGGWRLSFLVVGLLGVPVSIMLLAIKEPARENQKEELLPPSLSDVFYYIKANWRAFVGVYVGYPLVVVTSFAQLIWGPTYFLRIHGYTIGEYGLIYGLVIGIGGTAALLLGGFWSDFLWRRGQLDAPMRIVLGSVIVQAPFLIAAFLCSNSALALFLFSVGVIVLCLNGGLLTATLQILSPEPMRGRISAIYLILAYLIGAGLGPMITGLLTQNVFGGPMGLGLSLATMAAVTLPLSAVILVSALESVRVTAQNLLTNEWRQETFVQKISAQASTRR